MVVPITTVSHSSSSISNSQSHSSCSQLPHSLRPNPGWLASHSCAAGLSQGHPHIARYHTTTCQQLPTPQRETLHHAAQPLLTGWVHTGRLSLISLGPSSLTSSYALPLRPRILSSPPPTPAPLPRRHTHLHHAVQLRQVLEVALEQRRVHRAVHQMRAGGSAPLRPASVAPAHPPTFASAPASHKCHNR
jgi:hypothetical protein